jgi:hypothetical protein
MRWLWKGWPTPIKAGLGSSQLQEILIPGEGWTAVAEGLIGADRITADASGDVYFGPDDSDEVRKLDPDGRASKVADKDEDALAAALRGRVTGHKGVAFELIEQVLMLTLPDGSIEPQELGGETPDQAGRITLSPDQSLLYVADAASKWVYSYQVQTDGSIKHGQKYYHLHVPDDADDAGAGGMQVDRDGRLYVATRMGVQVCDQAGRVNAIIPTPAGAASDICFGGPERNVLYAACGDAVYKRKVKTQGVDPSSGPIKPKAPRL